jgi:hypothetical protein
MLESAWQTVEVRDGEKGPLVVEVAWTLVQARTEGRVRTWPSCWWYFASGKAMVRTSTTTSYPMLR